MKTNAYHVPSIIWNFCKPYLLMWDCEPRVLKYRFVFWSDFLWSLNSHVSKPMNKQNVPETCQITP